MKKHLFLLIFSLSAVCLLAQNKPASTGQKTDEPSAYSLSDLTTPPLFPGGEKALMMFILETVKYPQEARQKGIEGNVVVSFVIDEDGEVTDAKIAKDVAGGCGAEALRVVEALSTWEPGLIDGKAVSVQYTIPIQFRTH